MFDEHRRPLGRPFYLLALFLLWRGVGADADHHDHQRGIVWQPLGS